MNIIKNSGENIFVLDMKSTHYVIAVAPDGLDRHIYWGEKNDPADYDIFLKGDENSNHPALDEMKREASVFGSTFYGECVLKATFSDGCREINPEFTGYKMAKDTLILSFKDKYYGFCYSINYKIFPDTDIFSKSITVKNTGKSDIVFEKLASAEFTLPETKPYKIKNTNGAWGAEFLETETLLDGGKLVFESRRGASNHNNSPYFIAHRNADEEKGDVFFASLAYSGNFKVTVLRDLYSVTRAVIGMNDFDFSHTLKAGESFETPRVYAGFADGFGNMSRDINRFALEHILPHRFADKPLPVLYNSWEATEFNVSASQQTALAKIAADIGCELFVTDDGWFGKRNNDKAGLGDWYVNKEKFPNGLEELITFVNERGMDFGLWVEPEMVNKDSDLYRAHPDWVYHYPHRAVSELRHQLVLNMTRDDVKEYIFGILDFLLENYNIKYIKWDMNRPFSETGAENLYDTKMYSYLHTKAVYDIADKLRIKHPDVMLEACASGGGRADLGALSHFDQCWTSDNTDAVDRMTIQKGYSLLHPIKAMRAWVTDISWYNKPCPLDFRFNIAMQGALGLGGSLEKYTEEDLKICRENIALYKKIRHLIQFGDLYRIMDYDTDEILFNGYVNREKTKAVYFLAARGTRFFRKTLNLTFDGLENDSRYRIEFDGKEIKKSGAYLKNAGIPARIIGAHYNKIILAKKL